MLTRFVSGAVQYYKVTIARSLQTNRQLGASRKRGSFFLSPGDRARGHSVTGYVFRFRLHLCRVISGGLGKLRYRWEIRQHARAATVEISDERYPTMEKAYAAGVPVLTAWQRGERKSAGPGERQEGTSLHQAALKHQELAPCWEPVELAPCPTPITYRPRPSIWLVGDLASRLRTIEVACSRCDRRGRVTSPIGS